MRMNSKVIGNMGNLYVLEENSGITDVLFQILAGPDRQIDGDRSRQSNYLQKFLFKPCLTKHVRYCSLIVAQWSTDARRCTHAPTEFKPPIVGSGLHSSQAIPVRMRLISEAGIMRPQTHFVSLVSGLMDRPCQKQNGYQTRLGSISPEWPFLAKFNSKDGYCGCGNLCTGIGIRISFHVCFKHK